MADFEIITRYTVVVSQRIEDEESLEDAQSHAFASFELALPPDAEIEEFEILDVAEMITEEPEIRNFYLDDAGWEDLEVDLDDDEDEDA